MNYANYHIVLNGEKKIAINVLSSRITYYTSNHFAKNRKSRAFNPIQMFEQIITHFGSSFTECIWYQNFSLFYNVCGAINILFELAASAFFSINASSLFRTLMKKDYNQEKFKLNHNVVMKLLQKRLRKSW